MTSKGGMKLPRDCRTTRRRHTGACEMKSSQSTMPRRGCQHRFALCPATRPATRVPTPRFVRPPWRGPRLTLWHATPRWNGFSRRTAGAPPATTRQTRHSRTAGGRGGPRARGRRTVGRELELRAAGNASTALPGAEWSSPSGRTAPCPRHGSSGVPPFAPRPRLGAARRRPPGIPSRVDRRAPAA